MPGNMEILKLGNVRQVVGPNIQQEDLADIHFRRHIVPDSTMAIWLMNLTPNKYILPWYGYRTELDDDIQTLKSNWSVVSPQSLFDLLFLNALSRFGGKNLFVIFTGDIKSNNWKRLSESDQRTYSRGQSCVYHLEGSYGKKINVNWVPFYQPQSLVKDPKFDSLWHLYLAKHDEQNDVNAISFFSLSDLGKLPEVIKLLVNRDEKRSENLAALVDWFGVYSSPLREGFTTSALVYSNDQKIFSGLSRLESQITGMYDQAKAEFLKKAEPRSALRVISRNVTF